MNKILKFFDHLEDNVRGRLSHYPIAYSIIGGIGIVLFWRGVDKTAEMLPFMTGPISFILSVAILLLTGLFVSFFIGDNIIIAGLRSEKKLVEKEEKEINTEEDDIAELRSDIREIKHTLNELNKVITEKK